LVAFQKKSKLRRKPSSELKEEKDGTLSPKKSKLIRNPRSEKDLRTSQKKREHSLLIKWKKDGKKEEKDGAPSLTKKELKRKTRSKRDSKKYSLISTM